MARILCTAFIQIAMLAYLLPTWQLAALAQQQSDYISELERVTDCWPLRRMPLKVCVIPATRVRGFRQENVSAVYEAFQTWQQVTRGQISFTQVRSPQEADLTVGWAEELPKGHSHASGVTQQYHDNEGVCRAEITLLTYADHQIPAHWQVWLKLMKVTALHEVGHALGLGHSSDPHDVMTPNYFLDKRSVIALTSRDVNTLWRLYNDPEVVQSRQQRLAIRKNKNDIAELGNQGNKYYNAGDFERARYFFEQAFAIDNSHRSVRQNLAMTYYELGRSKLNANDLQTAEQLLTKAISIDDGHYLNGAGESLLARVRRERTASGTN